MYRTIVWLAFIKSNETSSAAKFVDQKQNGRKMIILHEQSRVSWTNSIQDTTSTIGFPVIMNGFFAWTNWASSWDVCDGRCNRFSVSAKMTTNVGINLLQGMYRAWSPSLRSGQKHRVKKTVCGRSNYRQLRLTPAQTCNCGADVLTKEHFVNGRLSGKD